jgi:Uma2 family endonuclease
MSIIRDRRIRGVPDILVEILSPGNTAYDRQVKMEAYARAGVPEYAIVDPATRTVSHYRLEAPGRYADPQVHGAPEVMSFDCLPTIRVPVGELFAGAPDTTL